MAKWTLGEMISDLTNRVGRSDIPQSVISLYLNQAYLDIVDMTDPAPHERIAVSSTTSGENRIKLPPDFAEPLSLSYLSAAGNSGKTIRYSDYDQFDAWGFGPVGQPDRFALFGEWIELHPSPSSAWSLQLRYRSFATTLIATTDVPSLSTRWRLPVVMKAQSYIHQWLAEPDRAMLAEDLFLRHVSALETDRGHRQHRMGVRIVY